VSILAECLPKQSGEDDENGGKMAGKSSKWLDFEISPVTVCLIKKKAAEEIPTRLSAVAWTNIFCIFD